MVNSAVRVIHLSTRLPKTPAGKHVAGQILRSGTSPAPNYSEARAAESYADFVHKLGVVLKELNETHVWLRIIKKGELIKAELLTDITDENLQLCRIMTSSIQASRATAKPSQLKNEK